MIRNDEAPFPSAVPNGGGGGGGGRHILTFDDLTTR